MKSRNIKSGSADWERYREIYRSSLWDFCFDILGYRDIDYQFFHEECKIYDENLTKGVRFQLRLFPRFHLKSSIYTIGGCLQDLCKNRNYTQIIISDTDDMAQSWLEVIALNILQNEDLYFFFPEIRPTPDRRTKWNKHSIIINRDIISPDPSIFACGITTNVVGKHPNKILFDDVVTYENTETIAKIAKTKMSYEHLMSLPDPKVGRVEANGTRYMHDDLYDTMIKSGLYCIRERAVEEGEVDEKGNKIYIFPKKFDDEAMAVIKANQSPFVTSCQYYNKPTSHEDQLFTEDMFKFYDELPKNGVFYITVDPASSVSSSADKSAIVACLWAEPDTEHPLGAIYVHSYVHKRLKTDSLIDHIIEKYIEIRPVLMSVEVSATFGGMWEYLMTECNRRGLGGISMRKFIPKSTQGKYERICMLQPKFKQGMIYMKKNHFDLQEQLLHYTGYKKKEHDDLIDAFAQQLFVGRMPEPVEEKQEDEYGDLYGQRPV